MGQYTSSTLNSTSTSTLTPDTFLNSAESPHTIKLHHARAWIPYLDEILVGEDKQIASQVTKKMSQLPSNPSTSSSSSSSSLSSSPNDGTISCQTFISSLGLTPSQLTRLESLFHDTSRLTSILSHRLATTRVHCEDLLITLQVLLEDFASLGGDIGGDEEKTPMSDEEANNFTTLEGISDQVYARVQESLENVIERIGQEENERRSIKIQELEEVLNIVPIFQQAALVNRLIEAIKQQGMTGEEGDDEESVEHTSSSVPTTTTSTSSAITAASSSKKRMTNPSSSSFSSGAKGGFGDLDLTITGVGIKAPSGLNNNATSSSSSGSKK